VHIKNYPGAQSQPRMLEGLWLPSASLFSLALRSPMHVFALHAHFSLSLLGLRL